MYLSKDKLEKAEEIHFTESVLVKKDYKLRTDDPNIRFNRSAAGNILGLWDVEGHYISFNDIEVKVTKTKKPKELPVRPGDVWEDKEGDVHVVYRHPVTGDTLIVPVDGSYLSRRNSDFESEAAKLLFRIGD